MKYGRLTALLWLLAAPAAVVVCDLVDGRQNSLRQPVVVTGSGLTVGHARAVTTVNCAGQKHAFIVRQSTLTLVNVRLVGCSHQAILLEGPAAKLVARDSTLSNHGSSSTKAQGVVISARKATVHLTGVVIIDNRGLQQQLLPAADDAPGALQPSACNLSVGAPVGNPAAAATTGTFCGDPTLQSAVICLQQSSMTLNRTRISNNTAGAAIVAEGSGAHTVLITQGCQLDGNNVTWLVVADSLGYDKVGRTNLMPQQAAPSKPSSFRAAFSTYDFVGRVRTLKRNQLKGAAQLLGVERLVGRAPAGQAPLQLQLHHATMAGNNLGAGLMWLRLVNTTWSDVSITSNAAMQRNEAAAGALLRRGNVAWGDVETWPALDACNINTHYGALLQVQGPSGFDMLRCNISNNVHPAGALLRVTDGMGLTSLRNSTLNSNVVASVVRFEGRTWVEDAASYDNATATLAQRALAVQPAGMTKRMYRDKLLQRWKALAKAERATQDAALLVHGCNFKHNVVFHSVVVIKGHLQPCSEYEKQFVSALLPSDPTQLSGHSSSGRDAAQPVTRNAASWWVVDSVFSHNLLTAPPGTSASVNDTAGMHNSLSTVLSHPQPVLSAWASNHSLCMAALQAALQGSNATSSASMGVRSAAITAFATTGFLRANLTDNAEFDQALSLHSSAVTVAGARFQRNSLNTNVMRVCFSTLRMHDCWLVDNKVTNGSIVDMRSVEAIMEQVHIERNERTSAVELPEENSTALSAGRTAPFDRSATPMGGSPPRLRLPTQPGWAHAVWRLRQCHILGGLHGITVVNNTGEGWGFAVDLMEYSLHGPLTNLVVSGNNASGVRLIGAKMWYDGQDLTIRNVSITDNNITDQCGGLSIGHFTSGAGKELNVVVAASNISNNRHPPDAAARIIVQGGGIALVGAPADSRMQMGPGLRPSPFGKLQNITFSILNSTIHGNLAEEGGGVWSSWPVNIHSCSIMGNTAVRVGGGVFLQGEAVSPFAAPPDVISMPPSLVDGVSRITATSISANTASCGGGLACDSCRVVVTSSSIAGNRAATDLYAHTCDPGPKPDDVSSRAGGTPTCLLRPPSSTDFSEVLVGNAARQSSQRIGGIVAGAGGAIAAIAGRSSYVAVCGSSLTGNSAWVGGLVYLSTPANGSNCPETCPPVGWSPCTSPPPAQGAGLAGATNTTPRCAVQLHDVDWTNTTSYGQLSSGSIRTRGFNMICSNSSLPTTPGSCGCGEQFQKAHRGSILGGAGGFVGPVWQLSNTLSLVNTTCWNEVMAAGTNPTTPGAREWADCLYFNSSAGDAALRPIQVITGDPVSISVVIGGPRQNALSLPAPEEVGAPIGTALMSQDSTSAGWFYIVGPTATVITGQQGAEALKDVVFQHRHAPNVNREFDIYVATSWGGRVPRQNDIQVKLRVKLMRCSFGRQMTVNRCIQCGPGSFSLQPNISCQPCITPGGSCTNGLLHPADGYFMPSPFVPQVLRCPLSGACTGRVTQEAAGRGRSSALWAVLNRQPHPQRMLLASNSSTGAAWQGEEEEEDVGVERSEALLQYSTLLADALMHDPMDGPPMLLDVPYQTILHEFQSLQCAPGYKGLMCGVCDPSYVDMSGDRPVTKRYALFMGGCVDCTMSPHVTRFVLFLLFILLFGYTGLGIACQVKSEGNTLMSAQASTHNVTQAQAADSGSDGTSTAGTQLPAGQPFQANSPAGHVCLQAQPTHCQVQDLEPPLQQHGQGSSAKPKAVQMAGLVEVWKALTSYVQVLAMVRFLPVLRGMSGGMALTFLDLSTFTQFAAFDCVLPGSPDKLAYTRILLSAFGLPMLLFLAFLLAWMTAWGLHRAMWELHARLITRVHGTAGITPGPRCCPQVVVVPQHSCDKCAEDVPMSAVTAAGKHPKDDVQESEDQPANAQPHPKAFGEFSKDVANFTARPASTLRAQAAARLAKAGANQPPPRLHRYLLVRMLVTTGILAYSCYPMFTSNMMQLLACQPVLGMHGSAQNTGCIIVAGAEGFCEASANLLSTYGTMHYQWLQQRFNMTANPADDPSQCHPGGSSHICQVTGSYWRQDYTVQCFAGEHLRYAILGAVMLTLCGLVIPLVLGIVLWLNRSRLAEPMFALKYSFFYNEYKDSVCFYECIIMGRKLAFLAIFLAFTPELEGADKDETVAILQLQLATILCIILLVLQERFRPFKEALMNTLERLTLVTLSISFQLSSCSLALSGSARWRRALIGVTMALNLSLLLCFVWLIVRRLWNICRGSLLRVIHRRSISGSTGACAACRRAATICRTMGEWAVMWNRAVA